MYFNGNKKKIDNNGIIFTTIGKINIDDLIKISERNESYVDYLGYLIKNKSLKRLKYIFKSHLVNSQIVITNFVDDSNEVLNSKYIYENITKKKTSYLLKNVYLSSFFSNDYINYIIKNYKQIMISFNCKYDNKIYINNNFVYFYINDYTKMRLITHKNVYKDKNKLNHVIVIDIHNETKKLENDDNLYENNEFTCYNKSINENDSNDKYRCNNTMERNYNLSVILKKNYDQFNKYENTNNNNNKLKETYENFFTDFYTYPVDLLCIFNNCDENFTGILRNVLANNKSKNVQIYLINLKYHECYYKISGSICLKDSCKFTYNNFNINKNHNIMNNQLDDIDNQINMNKVVDIYKNIFSNVQNELHNLDEIPVDNELRHLSNLSVNSINNEKDLIFDGSNYSNKGKKFHDSYIYMRKKDAEYFYELNMDYIEKEFLETNEYVENKKNEKSTFKNIYTHENNYDFDIYDLKINNKNGKEYNINDKKFYINYDSSSSDVSLSFIENIKNTKISKINKKEDILKPSTTNDFLKKYMKSSNLEQNKNDESLNLATNEKKEENKLDENKRIYEETLLNNMDLEKDESEEQYKLKKIKKVLNFLQKNREDYFKINKDVLNEENLYCIMDNFSEIGREKKKEDIKKKKFDEFVNYLIEFIGRIHLDIKINIKKNSKFLVKKLKNYYQIQKIILNNGLINNCNIYNIFNFLIDKLIKKNVENKNKLHYVLSIFGQDYNFINYDKYFQETRSQSSIHIFFFYSNDKIYIMILDTVNRLL
ncbi:conserved Plasmodium protein, unknown function [Plasmodium gallinaceum]|uniref:Uncharacterized protein n=1 Tax=Plasmodium gallinaceum TaxID=5849 RepID=A0A1J1GY11_PLAGA|nr:conserved Plasmodium protein, unknown function [Plasmodium gallinaceum]CRG96168.1 conserved Plasmodium protein, unknown function [Plasmodium gallinaceum]